MYLERRTLSCRTKHSCICLASTGQLVRGLNTGTSRRGTAVNNKIELLRDWRRNLTELARDSSYTIARHQRHQDSLTYAGLARLTRLKFYQRNKVPLPYNLFSVGENRRILRRWVKYIYSIGFIFTKTHDKHLSTIVMGERFSWQIISGFILTHTARLM